MNEFNDLRWEVRVTEPENTEPVKQYCEWTVIPYQGAMVSCTGNLTPMGNTPEEMGMKFCCFCGKNIKEIH